MIRVFRRTTLRRFGGVDGAKVSLPTAREVC